MAGTRIFHPRQLWGNLRETKIFCLSPRKGEFFSRRSRRLCKFYGRSGILPLHFCYFFLQTPSAESATEYGKLRGNAGMAGTGIFSRRFRRLRRFYGRMRVSRIQFNFHSANLAVPKALKLRERVSAMANPHKSSRKRERVGVKQKQHQSRRE